MKRKKMMSLLLSAVAAVSMIAGCGNQAAGTSGEGNAPTSESREAGTDAAAAEETGERPTISIMCIDMALFRIRNFAIGIAGNIVCRLGGSCLPYLMPLFFQVVLGYSALQSGMSLIPLALSNLLAKTVAPRLLGKFGYRNIMVVNTFTIGSLLASFRFVGPGTHELILLGMLALLGGANSIQFTCMNTLTLIDLPNADASSGNSLLSTIMQLSIAVSIAAASLLLDSFGGHSATSGKAVETAFHATFATIGAIAAASSFIFALVDKDKGITRKRRKAA